MLLQSKAATTEWLDRKEFPFEPHYFNVAGGRLHYVDEGQGTPIVFLHGNPTWSFMYRGMIRDLSMKHRCIAIDLLGFGLSDKPHGAFYSPECQARAVASLLDSLDLREATMVVHEFGGPIGLSWAIDHRERVARVAIFNSWLWPVRDNHAVKKLQASIGNPLSKLMNVAITSISRAFHDKLKLSDKTFEHYKKPLANSHEREGVYGLVNGLTESSPWLSGLWARHDALRGKPMLLLWGMDDKVFGVETLHKWTSAFPNASVETFSDCGHFVPEECAKAAEAALYLWMDGRSELDHTHAGIFTQED